MTDNLDIAYLAIGADQAWRQLVDERNTRPSCFDGLGQDGVIADVIAFATELHAAWSAIGDNWAGGVWYYDVSEALGCWIIRQWVEIGECPSHAQVKSRIDELVKSSQL